jgi:hypothetical protein
MIGQAGGAAQASVVLDFDDQIADTAAVTLSGDGHLDPPVPRWRIW